MKLIIQNATDFTPSMRLDPVKLEMEFDGISRPENVGLFYQQVLDWIDELEDNIEKVNGSQIKVIFKLTYCNSASQKFILMILERIISLRKHGVEPVVDWYYDEGDDQMLEDGEDISDVAELEFNFHTF